MDKYRYPTTEELYALERAARRERAREVAALIVAAAGALRSFFARFAAKPVAGRNVRHA